MLGLCTTCWIGGFGVGFVTWVCEFGCVWRVGLALWVCGLLMLWWLLVWCLCVCGFPGGLLVGFGLMISWVCVWWWVC